MAKRYAGLGAARFETWTGCYAKGSYSMHHPLDMRDLLRTLLLMRRCEVVTSSVTRKSNTNKESRPLKQTPENVHYFAVPK